MWDERRIAYVPTILVDLAALIVAGSWWYHMVSTGAFERIPAAAAGSARLFLLALAAIQLIALSVIGGLTAVGWRRGGGVIAVCSLITALAVTGGSLLYFFTPVVGAPIVLLAALGGGAILTCVLRCRQTLT